MDKERLESYVHYNMAFIGGFLGVYALLNHHELFSSAQTSNMIHIAMVLVGQDYMELLLRVGMLAVYMMGMAATVLLVKYTRWHLQLTSVLVNAVAVLALFFLSGEKNDYLALYPACFAMAFQWNSFKGAYGYVSSSIFSTNNLRQFTTSLTEYLCDKDKSHLRKTKFYGYTLLFFHLGVVFSYMVYLSWQREGVLFCLLPIGVSGILVLRSNEIFFKEMVKKVEKSSCLSYNACIREKKGETYVEYSEEKCTDHL